MNNVPPYIALGSRLLGIPEVLTLGVKPNFTDYSLYERQLIAHADVILYPTLNYAQFFTTMGKRIFPSVETYLYADEKIKQTTLFTMLGIPHPRTRIYYHRQNQNILKDFSFPFIAKKPRASARGRGVYKISKPDELEQYLRHNKIAYIQEYLPHTEDLRVVLINYQKIIAYWRRCAPHSFKTNLSQGGIIDFENIPAEALRLAEKFARQCKFNDVGLDLIHHEGEWHLIEANRQYGRKGLKMKGMVLKEIIRKMLLSGSLIGRILPSKQS